MIYRKKKISFEKARNSILEGLAEVGKKREIAGKKLFFQYFYYLFQYIIFNKKTMACNPADQEKALSFY